MDKTSINLIIKVIDEHLDKTGKIEITAVEAAEILDRKGILADSPDRPGRNLRNILRTKSIKHAYQVGVFWKIPNSTSKVLVKPEKDEPAKKKTMKGFRPTINSNVSTAEESKLIPIAEYISKNLEKKYGLKPKYSIEYTPVWLTSVPNRSALIDCWKTISNVYSKIVGNRYSLDNQLKLVTKEGKQKYDIWFHEPFSFAVEFDESQHFNQFRGQTLEYYNEMKIGFDLSEYKILNSNVNVKPGKSGFHSLKSNDPLFPKMLEGENQDNRHRQRAFRDFLKDLLPLIHSCNPTVRIPYHLVNKKINGFTNFEMEMIGKYLSDKKLYPIINEPKL